MPSSPFWQSPRDKDAHTKDKDVASAADLQAMLIRRDFNAMGHVNELQSGRRTALIDVFRFYGDMSQIPRRYGWASWRRFQAHGDAGGKLHKAFAAANGEHWKIDCVCTDPELQGDQAYDDPNVYL